MSGIKQANISHPVLDRASAISLYATETRVFVLAHSSSPYLFELEAEGTSQPPQGFRVVEGLDGLGIKCVKPGTRDRLMVVTDGDEAFLIDARTKEPRLVPLSLCEDETISMVGLGSDFEIIVTDKRFLIRGTSESIFSSACVDERRLWSAGMSNNKHACSLHRNVPDYIAAKGNHRSPLLKMVHCHHYARVISSQICSGASSHCFNHGSAGLRKSLRHPLLAM